MFIILETFSGERILMDQNHDLFPFFLAISTQRVISRYISTLIFFLLPASPEKEYSEDLKQAIAGMPASALCYLHDMISSFHF